METAAMIDHFLKTLCGHGHNTSGRRQQQQQQQLLMMCRRIAGAVGFGSRDQEHVGVGVREFPERTVLPGRQARDH
jgi:hypothetical protein